MMSKARDDSERRRPRWKTPVALLAFVAIAFLALMLPDHPAGLHAQTFMRLPLEIPLAALVLLLLPRRWRLPFAALLTLVVAVLLFLKIADIGVQSAFQRRFNPYLDIKMLADGWNLLSGSIGTGVAGLAIALVLAAFVALLLIFFWSGRQMAAAGRSARWMMAAGFAIVLVAGAGLWAFGPAPGAKGLVEARTGSYLAARLALVTRSIADMRIFEKALAGEDKAEPAQGLFQAIRGRDVVLIFVESYGRSAVEDPRYGSLIGPRLNSVEHQLDAAGFASASGWTRSPTVGGISWLAHGTLLSGLWIDSQARYDRLMISGRPSLNRLFRQAGWKTAAIMPAITMDWPEAAYFGYDQILAAKDLGYKGKPFNWVTMPDQYTLSAFERLARMPAKAEGKPVMAEMALISSHAPWTPVPTLIDWAKVGDGTAFNDQATRGDPPSVVWADPERVRRQYIATIDYSLQTLGDYIARFGEDAVFIFLGDHQPAEIITGPDASRDVPIHIVSRDKALIARLAAEGFTPGMTPAATAPDPPMDRMREKLIRVFSTPGTPSG